MPVTVPEGCVGRRDVRVRVNVQGCMGRVARAAKSVGWDGVPVDNNIEARGSGSGSRLLDGAGDVGTGRPFASRSVSCDVDVGAELPVSFEEENGSGIKYALTDCSVPRDGFSVGLVVVSHVSRCLMNFLSIFFPPLLPPRDITPLSSAYKHRIARAMPTERSRPVEQQIRISPISSGREEMKEGRRESCVRRSREPSFPAPQGRCKYFFFRCSGVGVVRGSGVQLIIVLKGEMSMF